ncbi:MAG TPA: SUF system NifU family Fe-S cluster assembly protein [Paenalcaligenes sp.]|nr:SUF system NifU family Fe-S cluster assembly protein [Paenalcaligenes sp.]
MSDDFGNLRELYQEVIFDHNRNPRNFRYIADATHQAVGHNPLCGDQLTIYLKVNGDQLIEDVSFIGQGCAISKASASLMTEAVLGKNINEADALFNAMHQMFTHEHPDLDLGKLEVLSGVREFPVRVKCATLAWHSLHNALHGTDEVAQTE